MLKKDLIWWFSERMCNISLTITQHSSGLLIRHCTKCVTNLRIKQYSTSESKETTVYIELKFSRNLQLVLCDLYRSHMILFARYKS